MQGDKKVVEYLNKILKNELTAINQYFLHSSICRDWGYLGLAGYMRQEAMEEMHHADVLIQRILFLESLPNLREMSALRIGKDVKKQLENDLALEIEAIARLNEAIAAAVAAGDNGSRDLFQKILVDEEGHVDWLEAQLGMIQQMGLGVYLSQQMGSTGGGAGAGAA